MGLKKPKLCNSLLWLIYFYEIYEYSFTRLRWLTLKSIFVVGKLMIKITQKTFLSTFLWKI